MAFKVYCSYILCLYVCMISLPYSEGARVLLLPYPFSSHVNSFLNIGEALMSRGHEVHAVTSPSLPDLEKFTKGKVNFIVYHAADPDFYQFFEEGDTGTDFVDLMIATPMKTDFMNSIDGYKEMCTNPLKDQNLYKQLKDMKFDIAIVDVFPSYRCMLVLTHRLGLPHVSIEATDEPWLLRNPALPSAWPTNMAYKPYTERMNFWERLDNLWQVIDWAMIANSKILYLEDGFLEEFFYETPPVSLNKLAGKSVLWLIDNNPVLDYPRPKMANEFHIGGLTTKPAKPINEALEQFMNSNPEGVVVVSFGSMPLFPPDRVMAKLLGAFKQVKYNVIMKYPMTPPRDIPKNVRLQEWLPQNDLLGHKNTKLFITHCGSGGQNEALYHGVPMVGIPLFADQPYNAKRMVYHGFGQALIYKSFNQEQLTTAINEVISNRSYHDNIKRASAIFKDQPMMPREMALFWIEHVIKHGGAHMHSHALDMPWYEYLMLDILAFVLGVFMVFVIVVSCAAKKLFSVLMTNGKKEKHE